ncbi:MAG: homoserine dehydrogenase [Acidobacteria bacterium]|nr:homoserine dehydrogenase [Acidobacteriota bacterium]
MKEEATGAPRRDRVSPFKVAIVGFGTVGRSVARILCEHTPVELRLTHVYNRDVERKRVSWVPPHVEWTGSIEDVLSSNVDVMVELIGGLKPAENWIRRALLSGKSVVTANKQLISQRGPELLELARRQGERIGFEASVAGGIPVVSGLQAGLAGDQLFRVAGILNGTCNYILTRMEASRWPFVAAVKEAQDLGFAEANPAEDVDGYDARAKLAILARVGLQCQIHPSDIVCRSISVIEAIDFTYALRLGCTIRQVSRAEKDVHGEAQLFACVQPALVPLSSPLARVQGSQNLVMTTGKFGGETVFSGHGAGGDPTAVAVVSDLIGIARSRRELDRLGRSKSKNAIYRIPRGKSHRVIGEFASSHYVRFTVRDRPGIIASLATIFSNYGINIDAVFQEPGSDKSRLPFVITLEECSNSVLESALGEIKNFDFHVQPPVSLPILV